MKDLKNTVTARFKALPPGAFGILAGLLVLGVTNYAFLVVAGQVLGDAKYAPLGVLWIIVFLLGPGFLYPIEQEVARAVAARRSLGQGIAPVVWRAAVIAGVIMVVLVIAVSIAAGALNGEFFDDQTLMLFALIAALVSYAASYVARGACAGNGSLNSYGLMIGGEGLFRIVGAGILAIVGVSTAGPYGLIVGITPLIAFAIIWPREHKKLDAGPTASWSELSSNLGNLIAGAVLSQVLLNAAPLYVKYNSTGTQQEMAGAFLKAVVITRIPMFLFQAVQAVMLPRLTAFAVQQQFDKFKTRLFEACLVVGLLGAAGVIGSFLLGNFALSMFGSDYPLPTSDLALLAAGCAVFLIATMLSQALIALNSQSSTVVGWAVGVIAFAILVMGPGSLQTRAEWAMIGGSFASTIAMYFLMVRRLSKVKAQHIAIADPANPVVDLALDSETYV